MLILVINPGSTSTKVAVFRDRERQFVTSIAHTPEELAPFEDFTDQEEFRYLHIVKTLVQAGYGDARFDAVIGRGSLAKPVEGGVYTVNEQMLDDARHAVDRHACDLGCILARRFSLESPDSLCLIADPGSVDELNDYARITGSPLMPHYCIWHALNQRAIARRYAAETSRRYEDMNLIICHMGGGISIAAHDHGRAVDVNNALNGDGPFSPERAGTLPAGTLVDLCYSGRYTRAEWQRRIAGMAGMSAHLGTNDMREALRRIDAGDEHARLIVDAMLYHTAKAIAAHGATLCGKVDAIIITGGMAHAPYVIKKLSERLDWLAPLVVYPGEDEMRALAENALAVLTGDMIAKPY